VNRQAGNIRIGSFNVEFSRSTTPEDVARMFLPFGLDLIGFCEVPDGDWTRRVGQVLGMDHAFVGAISSANHKDKYKSILSRWPLANTREIPLAVDGGWNPASVVVADVDVDGIPLVLHSLHICSCGLADGHARLLAERILAPVADRCAIAVGDFNSHLGDEDMKVIAEAGFRSTWDDLPIDLAGLYTYNAFDPKINGGVIDHIVYAQGSGIRAVAGGIVELQRPLSDHKPIWAEITLPGR
jgi:endonuclease/exonuclease/phosphatase family metal-dependent hydrolase